MNSAALRFVKPIQRPRPRPILPPRRPRGRLRALSSTQSPLDALMDRYGRHDADFQTLVVPRCMTALPENLTDILESLLPHGY